MGYVVCAGLGLTLGVCVGRWWILGIAAAPSLLVLVVLAPGFGVADHDGVTLDDIFFELFWQYGAPLIVGCMVGVAAHRLRAC